MKESCNEEEPEQYHNYMKMVVTHLSVSQAKETMTEEKYQEDKEAGNYKQNFISRSLSQTADLPPDRLMIRYLIG